MPRVSAPSARLRWPVAPELTLPEVTKPVIRYRGQKHSEDEEPREEDLASDSSDDSIRWSKKPRGNRKQKPTISVPPRVRASRKSGRKRAGSDDEAPIGSEYNIAPDNALFNAVRDPNSAVQSAVDDWIATYGEEEDDDTGPGVALAQLVNFLLRVRHRT